MNLIIIFIINKNVNNVFKYNIFKKKINNII